LDLISDYIDEYCGEIWFKEIIEELSSYSYERKREFDIVAALGMLMLANEELMFVTPRIDSKENQFRHFGFWTDERGIKHRGVIPDKLPTMGPENFKTAKTFEADYYGYERLRISSS